MTAFPAIIATLIALAVTLLVVFENLRGPFQGGRLLQVAWFIACVLWIAWWIVR
jgi:hypothetical protein